MVNQEVEYVSTMQIESIFYQLADWIKNNLPEISNSSLLTVLLYRPILNFTRAGECVGEGL